MLTLDRMYSSRIPRELYRFFRLSEKNLISAHGSIAVCGMLNLINIRHKNRCNVFVFA